MTKLKLQKNISQSRVNQSKGFVLLFAVLVSTLVLAVGISVISIALKQVVLSGSGRDSQYAFYAANTGAECALYWDLAGDADGDIVFATSTAQLSFDESEVTCLGAKLVPQGSNQNDECEGGIDGDPDWCVDNDLLDTIIETKFRISYADRPYCADVIVAKELAGTAVASTKITSRGYNTCDTANPRRIERALEFQY